MNNMKEETGENGSSSGETPSTTTNSPVACTSQGSTNNKKKASRKSSTKIQKMKKKKKARTTITDESPEDKAKKEENIQTLVEIVTRLTKHLTENGNYLHGFEDEDEEEECYEGYKSDWDTIYQIMTTQKDILLGNNRIAFKAGIWVELLLACYFCYVPNITDTIFDILLEKYQACFHMDWLEYNHQVKFWLLYHLPTDEMGPSFVTQNCQMIEKIIRKFPLTFKNEKVNYAFREVIQGYLAVDEVRVFHHIFGNYYSCKHLMGPIEEIYGRQQIKKWLGRPNLKFESLHHLFGYDDKPCSSFSPIRYLLELFKPPYVDLSLGFPSFTNNEEQRPSKFNVWNTDRCMEVSFTGTNNRESCNHLNSILSEIHKLPSSCLPPIRLSSANSIFNMDRLDVLGYFVVDPDIARGCHAVQSIDPIVYVDTAKDLIDFGMGISSFPNLQNWWSLCGDGITIKIRSISPDKSHNDNDDNSSTLWKQAFQILGSIESLDIIRIVFQPENESYVPVEGIQMLLETTQFLRQLTFYEGDERMLMEAVSLGLKRNKSLAGLEFNRDDVEDVERMTLETVEKDYHQFLDVIRHHNFTLTSFCHFESPLESLVRHYCNMNKAGRDGLMKPNATKRDAVTIFEKADDMTYSRRCGAHASTDVLYGLLRIRPDLWSSTCDGSPSSSDARPRGEAALKSVPGGTDDGSSGSSSSIGPASPTLPTTATSCTNEKDQNPGGVEKIHDTDIDSKKAARKSAPGGSGK